MDFVAKRVATSSTSTAAPKCPPCAWIGAISGSSCKCVQTCVSECNPTQALLISDAPFFSNHHLHPCHPVVRLFPSPGDSGAPSLPPLTSRRMRESLTRFPRWDKGFSTSSSCSWTLMIQPFDGSSS